MAEQTPKEAKATKSKTSPGEFIRQVRAETSKVVWPTPRRDGAHRDLRVHPGGDPVAVLPRRRFGCSARLFASCWRCSDSRPGSPQGQVRREKFHGTRWYIIHAYSGFENKVRDAILSEAERLGLSEGVEEVEVPTETVTEIKRGKKVQTERKFMPGYVLAKLNMTDDVYHLVKNTPKVTGFLGNNNKPQPISEKEAARYFGGVEEAKSAPKKDIQRRLRDRRPGQGAGRPLRQLQRRGGRARFRQGQGQGLRLHLRPRNAGRTRIRTGRTGQVIAAFRESGSLPPSLPVDQPGFLTIRPGRRSCL